MGKEVIANEEEVVKTPRGVGTCKKNAAISPLKQPNTPLGKRLWFSSYQGAGKTAHEAISSAAVRAQSTQRLPT